MCDVRTGLAQFTIRWARIELLEENAERRGARLTHTHTQTLSRKHSLSGTSLRVINLLRE